MTDGDRHRSRRRRLLLVLLAVVALFIYAYAVEETNVDLEEPLEPQRQANLIGLLRELARPDIFSFENETRTTTISVRMPCPEEVRGSQVRDGDRVLTLAPNCASTTQDVILLQGEGFTPNVTIVAQWRPLEATVPRRVAEFRSNAAGNFSINFTFPDIREGDALQAIQVVEIVSRRLVGFSPTAEITWVRIIETVLMALMASTIGTILAVPISFLAARNLMRDVALPLAAIMAGVIAIPIGGLVGYGIVDLLMRLAATLGDSAVLSLGAFAVTIAVTWPILRLGRPLAGADLEQGGRSVLPAVRLIGALLLLILSLAFLAQVGLAAGAWMEANLGWFSFIGNFIRLLSELTLLMLPALSGLTVALLAASYASRYAQEAVIRLEEGAARVLTAVIAAAGTALLLFGIGYAINWICLFGICRQLPEDTPQLLTTLAVPAVVGGIAAGALSALARPKRPYPIGSLTYTVTRGALNLLRAIEPVILGFVLVVWVGLGPFAGVLALMLSSIADLGKLFSEQVENIEQGPIEAVTATGANRLQTIVFAVIPQIVPQYIAFAFYRWDINVRLSTIIGFVGGGGIGLILFRSTNLTQYRQASVMVIAIALVVTVLDYVSSWVRRRII